MKLGHYKGTDVIDPHFFYKNSKHMENSIFGQGFDVLRLYLYLILCILTEASTNEYIKKSICSWNFVFWCLVGSKSQLWTFFHIAWLVIHKKSVKKLPYNLLLWTRDNTEDLMKCFLSEVEHVLFGILILVSVFPLFRAFWGFCHFQAEVWLKLDLILYLDGYG